MRSLNIAATGMQAQQLFVDVTSQNLANINTTAYKMERAEFQDLLYQNLRRVGVNSSDTGTIVPTGIQMGLGVKLAAVYRSTGQGTMQTTENPLDMAVQGKGMFQITLPDGTLAYTRDGAFQLSPDGIIVTADGYEVEPAITIPPDATSVNINESGEVSVTLQGQVDPTVVGQIQTVSFINEPGLQAIGNNLMLETTASGPPTIGTPGQDGLGTILQGALESSNVNPITELTNLIRAQRGYEQNSRVISKTDEMLQSLNQSV
ncbi:MAG: flagellar basal-body rod protein FlgG [Alphaproteobacteria bacterium]